MALSHQNDVLCDINVHEVVQDTDPTKVKNLGYCSQWLLRLNVYFDFTSSIFTLTGKQKCVVIKQLRVHRTKMAFTKDLS